MPGHPVSQADEAATEASINTLTELIRSHDAVFLLMDSRESRWLPTVIGAAENKIVINAALGFDSWLVMRHGAGPSAEDDEAREAGTTKGRRLGCYYCNDIVAPADVSVRGGGFESTKLIVLRTSLSPIVPLIKCALSLGLELHRLQQPQRSSCSSR